MLTEIADGDDINKLKDIHAHGLEELILLKYPYYLKQFAHSVQSLSKFQ